MKSAKTLFLIPLVMLASACQHRLSKVVRERVDSLNERAYRFRYIDVDSVREWSLEADSLSADKYRDGEAAALNNLAFVDYQQMHYGALNDRIEQIRALTHNQIQLLCADVMQMKGCQRTGDGLLFFDAKTRAEGRLRRIAEEEDDLSPEEQEQVDYARSELHIICSTYDYYQEQDSAARAEILQAVDEMENSRDTAQWVYLDYMMGSGGMILNPSQQEVTATEFDYLMECYEMASRYRLIYFQANSLQCMATMCADSTKFATLRQLRPGSVGYLIDQHLSWMPEGQEVERELPLALCQHALYLFRTYKDLFQTACTLRTLGELYQGQGEYEKALAAYQQALHCVNVHHIENYGVHPNDTLCSFTTNAQMQMVEKKWMNDSIVQTVPDWIAGIRERLSIVYSQMGLKMESDFNRNAYLDILEYNTQNRELLSRTNALKQKTTNLRINFLLLSLLVLIVLFLFYIYHRRQQRSSQTELENIRKRIENLDFTEEITTLQEEVEEIEEQLAISKHNIENQKVRNVENRAKVSLVHDVVPFLDRIIGEVIRMKRNNQVENSRLEYISELTDRIEQLNTILTEWVKVTQGDLKLHISTVELGNIFQLIAQGHYSYDQKGVKLEVVPTDLRVKADESLTLFMVNTLADNARKFTPEGGTVHIEAKEVDNCVEVSVQDTGCGLNAEDVDTLNNSKVYDPTQVGREHTDGKGFGFGIMNCRGIIEKYKKASTLMADCRFGVESQQGQGSRFWFRLPRVGAMIILFLCSTLCLFADEYALYDSVYVANTQARYADAIQFADQALSAINANHPKQIALQLLETSNNGDNAPEFLWLNDSVKADYELIVGIRNEVAISALALGNIPLYNYNNQVCTRLHKLVNQDKSLPQYLQQLESTQFNTRLLIILEVLSVLVIGMLVYRIWISRQMRFGIGIEDLDKLFDSTLNYIHNLKPAETSEEAAIQDVQNLFAEYSSSDSKEIKQLANNLQDKIIANYIIPCYQLTERKQAASDQTGRLNYEEQRIYIQNQILDNCLSTIKHESMYYPSRIRQLVDKMNGLEDLPQLDELVNFYRQIYTLLCRQADSQVAQSNFKRQAVTLSFAPELLVRADEILLDTLISKLKSGMIALRSNGLSNREHPIKITAFTEGNFVRIELMDDSQTKLPLPISELFYPHENTIPLLIAKQILREHDENLNHPGCQLVAEEREGGYCIYFTLPKINKK